MATLNVLYFARVRELTGLSSETLVVADEATIADALAALVHLHPALQAMLGSLRVAMAGEFVVSDARVIDGAEMVLIPPVSGGIDDKVALLDTALDAGRLYQQVSGPGEGAVVVFFGKVRDHARGRAVEVLEYEAYPSMATSEMRKLVARVEHEWPGSRAAIHHRVGRLVVDDVAVIAAAGHAHRGPAFEACRALIEGLKKDVPIWKKEIGPDGAEWVSDRP